VEREHYFEGVTVVSLVMCIESCAVGGMVEEETNVCWRRQSNANGGRHALMPSRDRSATYGKWAELTYQTRKECHGYSNYFG